MNRLYFSSLLGLTIFTLNCMISCSESDTSINATTQFLRVIYSEGPCCQNLVAIESFDLPDGCGQPYSMLYATNLADFNNLNFSVGDTLTIEFNFGNDCEAATAEYNCVAYCDIRHGTPIEILSIE